MNAGTGDLSTTVEQIRAEAHQAIIDAITRYTEMILTSSDIPVARRGALVAQLGKLTVQAARAAPLPNMSAALVRQGGFGMLAAADDNIGYPDDYPPLPVFGGNDLGNIQRQTIAALTAPKEVDKARTLEALIAARDNLSRDFDLSRDLGRALLVKKLDEKIERLIEELAPGTPDPEPNVLSTLDTKPLDIPDYEGD